MLVIQDNAPRVMLLVLFIGCFIAVSLLVLHPLTVNSKQPLPAVNAQRAAAYKRDNTIDPTSERLRKQRDHLSRELNRIQESYQKLRCKMRMQYGITETGSWCAVAVLTKHWTDIALVKALAKLLANKTVIGLGEGRGEYRKRLLGMGAVVHYDAFDGSPNITEITRGEVNFLDLTLPQYWLEPHDWAMSLEVIEHIPAQYENTVLDNIARVAREGIILSWAVPGQSGFHHFNNQPSTHVDDVLLQRSFERDANASRALKAASTLAWFRNNINVYRRIGEIPDMW